MKNRTTFLGKIVILAIILTLNSLVAYSQNFALIGAKWYYSNDTVAIPQNSQYLLYESVKDTNYQGKLCKKIERKAFSNDGNIDHLKPYFVHESNDSVYFFNDLFNKFTLLYDFSANVGDTLFYYIAEDNLSGADSTFRLVVDSVKSEMFGSQSLKKFYSHGLDDFEFDAGFPYVEKIGGLFWLFPRPKVQIPEISGPLRCYSDSLLNESFFWYSCDYLGADNLLENVKMRISPNPFSSVLNLSYELESAADVELSLYDILGKKYDLPELSAHSKEQSAGTHELSVNTASLPSGTYFLRIRVGDAVEYRKLVKLVKL